jgi:hypothetical protein
LEYRRRQPLGRRGKTRMSLLVVYVVLMITGDFVAYLIGLVIERNAPAASLPAFLRCIFCSSGSPGSSRSGSRSRGRGLNRFVVGVMRARRLPSAQGG